MILQLDQLKGIGKLHVCWWLGDVGIDHVTDKQENANDGPLYAKLHRMGLLRSKISREIINYGFISFPKRYIENRAGNFGRHIALLVQAFNRHFEKSIKDKFTDWY